MARYIDAETALKIIDNYAKTVTADGIVVVKAIRDIVEIITPTADVVPKSECDKWYYEYHAIKDELKQEKMYHKETEKLVDKYCVELQTAKSEIETLKDNNEHLAVILEETKAEVERLSHKCEDCAGCTQWKCDCANIELEVASEIFAEIENIFTKRIAFYEEMKKRSLLFHEITYAETMITNLTIYLQDIAKLKKKYTEGEDKPATEEKHFSPEDVRKMTNQEIREKYTAIRKSMERW